MKTEIKVLLYLKRNGQGKDGLCPLMGRIMVKGAVNSVTQFGCKIKVDPKLWNATSQRCTGKSRMAVTTNREIDRMLLLLQRRYNELAEISDDITAAQIRDAFQGMAEKQVTLMGLFRENNEEYALRVGVNRAPNTLYLYKNTYRLVEGFLKERYKVSDIPFKALDESFIEAFELYLRIDRKFQTGTSIGHVQRLKHIAQIAVNRAVVPFSPFKDFSPMKPGQKQMYLTREELDKLMGTTFDTPNRNFTRDMFLFSVFTGICYCDMRNLTEKNVVRDYEGNLWIETRRQKTGTPENVRLLDIAVKIMEKYRGMAPEGKLFPMLTKESMNIHLKKMAVQCGIDRNLSFHVARHTYATEICLSNGVPIETISRMMGHSNIRTTQIYAEITNQKVRKDFGILSEKTRDRYSLPEDNMPSRVYRCGQYSGWKKECGRQKDGTDS
ncbi:site-specific integrase [Parabacteroides merdae]|uniref:site-specific integrase n=1 Tax=Parabacteroides merdae TaxID=46503 RepID=UPI0039B585D1